MKNVLNFFIVLAWSAYFIGTSIVSSVVVLKLLFPDSIFGVIIAIFLNAGSIINIVIISGFASEITKLTKIKDLLEMLLSFHYSIQKNKDVSAPKSEDSRK